MQGLSYENIAQHIDSDIKETVKSQKHFFEIWAKMWFHFIAKFMKTWPNPRHMAVKQATWTILEKKSRLPATSDSPGKSPEVTADRRHSGIPTPTVNIPFCFECSAPK